MAIDLNPRHTVYVGSFDPLTLGHLDIIRRGVQEILPEDALRARLADGLRHRAPTPGCASRGGYHGAGQSGFTCLYAGGEHHTPAA